MNAPKYTQFTERMYANLPEVVRDADSINGYALKHYISAIGDVEDQVERLVARFSYLDLSSRLTLDDINDDYNYYGLDYSYFQVSDSKQSVQLTSNNNEPIFLRSTEAYRVVPNTTIYVGAVFRTDQQNPLNTYGLRLWYYDAAMGLIDTKDAGKNNGASGPQWVVVNSTDNTPNGAYYVRISPFGLNTSGASAKLWVDDVYVRSHYEVTTTNNLVSGGHNYLLRTEQQMVKQGDFDTQRDAQYMVDYLRAQAVDAAINAPNIVVDPSFEAGNGPYLATYYSESTSRVNIGSSAQVGEHVIRTVENSDGIGVSVRFRKTGGIIAGHTYTASVWARVPAGIKGYITGYFFDQAGSATGGWVTISPHTPGTGQWQLFTNTFSIVAPADVNGIEFRFNHASDTPAGTTTDIGTVMVQDLVRSFELEAEADALQENILLSAWDRGPSTELVDHALDGVPEIQAYRAWLDLKSTNAAQPGYARQVIQSVSPNATYNMSLLMVRDGNVPDTATLRVTITPDTGGPTVQTYTMLDYDRNRPHLINFTWNSPETVATAIINVEYIAPVPAGGLLINDVSMVRFASDVTQIGRYGDVMSTHVSEKVSAEIFTGNNLRGTGWIRYETMGDPDTEPMAPSDPDIPGGTSFIESTWHPTRPGNTYTFTGEMFSNNSANYVDLFIWYRNEGKGWGEAMLHRINASVLSTWVGFERTFTIPSNATEFRVNLDFYRGTSARVLDMRNVSLRATSDRSWYMAGSRPFAFNALATRGLNFLTKGDLVHYTAKVLVTGDTSGGRGGVRVYSNGSQVVHETMIRSVEKDALLQIAGSFQVPESLADLRVALYMNDPTPKHQAAYFLSDLEVVHSTQEYVKDPKNIITNGGFETSPVTKDWGVVTQRVEVRKNLVPNPIGPSAISTSSWRTTLGDSLTLVQDSGRTALKLIQSDGAGSSESLYMDPSKDYSDVPVGSTIRFSADVKVTSDTPYMRLTIAPYSGAARTGGSSGWLLQTVGDGWVRHSAEAVITELPEGGYFRCLFFPNTGAFPTGEGFLVRDVLVEVNTDGPFFDRYTEDTTLAKHTWDGTAHVQTRQEFPAPLNPSAYITTAMGYNKEDVPARPEDVPLGATSDLVDARTANTEWLPWLAQFAGKNISHFPSMEEARAALSSGNNFASGTIGAIQDAVATVLTGTKTVRVFAHTTDLTQIGGATQWDVSIVTRTSESPDISVMAEAVRLRNAKPAGVTFHFHKHQSTWDAVELANPTWNIWDTRDWTSIEEAGLADG